MKLRIGDQVLVTAGKNKGHHGLVEAVFPKTDRVVVPGANVYHKFRKATPGQSGGSIEITRPLPTASVALICQKCQKPTRVSFVVDKKGDKTRICAKCKEVITTKETK